MLIHPYLFFIFYFYPFFNYLFSISLCVLFYVFSICTFFCSFLHIFILYIFSHNYFYTISFFFFFNTSHFYSFLTHYTCHHLNHYSNHNFPPLIQLFFLLVFLPFFCDFLGFFATSFVDIPTLLLYYNKYGAIMLFFAEIRRIIYINYHILYCRIFMHLKIVFSYMRISHNILHLQTVLRM